ncbi:hypothetical protein Pcinc_006493 [Petrolisthes cinctipes]|uniref:Uncharacterized protein n=1 Tax=Petrolisthes cinctipes TaxID=88211 RepID=A0AAE1KXY8_PETCI|nr:hypothetical protein Pcinc_006493 [Petrolisthes cinctipes]
MSEDFSMTGECNYYMAREGFKSMPLALAFQHRHPLYSRVNQSLTCTNKLNDLLADQETYEKLRKDPTTSKNKIHHEIENLTKRQPDTP